MRISTIAPCALLLAMNAWCADWLTDGSDVIRSNWQKDEKILSTATAKNASPQDDRDMPPPRSSMKPMIKGPTNPPA